MEFKQECVQEFLDIFYSNFMIIYGFIGCLSLKLIQDINNKNLFFTISEWKNENDLEAYRNSEFFKNTWKKTKFLFMNKPEAWTTTIIDHSDDI